MENNLESSMRNQNLHISVEGRKLIGDQPFDWCSQ